jgi:hypothetical protein
VYNRKIAPTVSKIKKEIEDTIKISKSTLTLTLLDLGYKYKKSCDNRRLLYDQRSVINDRCNYLRKIRKFHSIHRTVRYASSLACSFNQIIWGIKWSSPRFNTMFLQSFDKSFVLPILAMFIYMLRCQKIGI